MVFDKKSSGSYTLAELQFQIHVKHSMIMYSLRSNYRTESMYNSSNDKMTLEILETKKRIRPVRVDLKCPH